MKERFGDFADDIADVPSGILLPCSSPIADIEVFSTHSYFICYNCRLVCTISEQDSNPIPVEE